jgi:NNP family nitrate/nitrite transporter-like MFS transporter
MGAFELVLGFTNTTSEGTMFGLVAGLALFLDACNGANFAVVPHVHPYANGVVSGIVGDFGNLGGIIFAIIFRYHGPEYAKSLWIIGVISLAANFAVSWIPAVSKKPVIVS